MKNSIDEFESMFRAAEREPFAYADVPLETVALITDGTSEDADALKASVLRFLPRLDNVKNWRVITGDGYQNVSQLLEWLNAEQTDLVITYRHLHEKSLIPQHSLGVYLDVLTQATSIPVLVLPGSAAHPVNLADRLCDHVMVVTDHILGEHALIDYSVRLCSPKPGGNGQLWLCHIEDELVFERYLRAISQIPEIETETAREQIDRRLLKDASDFIATCMAELKTHNIPLDLHSCVQRGHRLKDYVELVQQHDIDLLVANTKDEDQLAMHGMAYSLSVELTDIAMLLL